MIAGRRANQPINQIRSDLIFGVSLNEDRTKTAKCCDCGKLEHGPSDESAIRFADKLFDSGWVPVTGDKLGSRDLLCIDCLDRSMKGGQSEER